MATKQEAREIGMALSCVRQVMFDRKVGYLSEGAQGNLVEAYEILKKLAAAPADAPGVSTDSPASEAPNPRA